MFIRRLYRLALVAVLPFAVFGFSQAMAAETAALPEAISFFQYPAFTSAILSPDGRRVAMLVTPKTGSTLLAVMELATRETKVLVNAKSDVAAFRWVNDSRLVFNMTDRELARGEMIGGPGIFAINADGSGFKELAERRRNPGNEVRRFQKDVLPYFTNLMPDMGKQDSDTIYVSQHVRYRKYGSSIALFKLDTVTGQSEPVKRVYDGESAKTTGWMLDQNGLPRITHVTDDKSAQIHYLDPATGAWRKLLEYDPLHGEPIQPFAFAPDGTFYVRSRLGQDKFALYTYDLKANKINSKPAIAAADYDFNGALIMRGEQLLGVRYLVDAPGTLWFDEKLKQAQAKVDALLPATNNVLSFGRRSATPYALVYAASDAHPGQTYLYNFDSGTLELLGEQRPDIEPRAMGRATMVRYKARDGLEIPAYLTLPKDGKTQLPMVVLVHGGPWSRGSSGQWEAQVQFLASRGYAVLEPQYRGSQGFGEKHLRAGFKQWGLAMQDDLADGAKWAIERGIVDPKRICIAGPGYGGYATLMGLVRDPDLFRCGFAWGALTDIGLLYDVFWSDTDDRIKNFGLPVLVGDREHDAAQLKATSPLENAAKISQPLLLAYGDADKRVPIVHGTKFRDAVSLTNSRVEWLAYPDETNDLRVVKNKVDFWLRVEKFLGQHIGNGKSQ